MSILLWSYLNPIHQTEKSDPMPDMPYLVNKKMSKIMFTFCCCLARNLQYNIIYHFWKGDISCYSTKAYFSKKNIHDLCFILYLHPKELHSFLNGKNTRFWWTTRPFHVTYVIYLLEYPKEKPCFCNFF